MLAVQSWVQRRFYPMLMVLLAVGFAMLLVELLLTNHTDGIQLVAVAASVIGLVLTGAALFVRDSARLIVAGLMLLLSLTGVIGTFEHLEEREGRIVATELHQASPGQASYQMISMSADEDEEGEEGNEGEEAEEVPPPLAPLSLAGLSMMAAVVMVGEGKAQG